MRRPALALLAVMLLTPAFAMPAQACSVPCGRIYPLIIMKVEEGQPAMWDLAQGASVAIPATITYTFDMDQEGYTAATPNEPIAIRFEFPRKPDWAEIKVEPELVPIDVNNPLYFKPDTSDPATAQVQYVYTAPITITLTLTGRAVLRDGYDYGKLLVFAKSSESGLYQSGYGIKELRVVPEGAVHESDVAGERDVFTAVPLPAPSLAAAEASFDGTTVTMTPPSSAKFWEPGEFVATVDPAPAGRMVFAIHDEWGNLVSSTPPVDASMGEARLMATLAQPGRHTATLTLLPDAGTATPPLTYQLPFDAGSLEAEGYVYPKTYMVQTRENVPAPVGSSADALAQFERDIPFFVFDTAQSVAATLTLVTAAPVDLGRGTLANLQFSIHDPDGNSLQAGSVDPTKVTWSLRVGSVPTDGWYVLRIKGVGAPVATMYDARVEVNYASAHQARDRADGVPDATGGLLGSAGANLTLPVDGLAVWQPSDVTPALEGATGVAYTVTIYDANGTLAYASGLREGAASFSAPAPGTYRAFVFAEPTTGSVPFSPIVRAFTFDVGAGATTVATTYAIEDAWEAATSATESLLGYHAVHVYEGAAAPTVSGGELIDADGGVADGTAPGVYWLRVTGQGAPPAGSAIAASLEQTYSTAVALVGPSAAPEQQGGSLPIPGIAIALVLALVGAVAVGLALARR